MPDERALPQTWNSRQKNNVQIRAEITNAINANNIVTTQNTDMFNKISIIREKIKDREIKYFKINGIFYL